MKTTKAQRDILRLWVRSPTCIPTQHIIDVLDDFDELEALINTAQTADFLEAVKLEAAHQVGRWGPDDREQKSDVDWIWLMTYLASKAVFGKDMVNRINGIPLARWIANATRDYARTAVKEAIAQNPALGGLAASPALVDGDEKYHHRIVTIAAAAKNWFDNRPFLSREKRGEK